MSSAPGQSTSTAVLSLNRSVLTTHPGGPTGVPVGSPSRGRTCGEQAGSLGSLVHPSQNEQGLTLGISAEWQPHPSPGVMDVQHTGAPPGGPCVSLCVTTCTASLWTVLHWTRGLCPLTSCALRQQSRAFPAGTWAVRPPVLRLDFLSMFQAGG